ncbi:hypothetical protein GOODEAATRI_019117 [Goodea atripinnis]|uniref:Uncharacterized protein n=1 Tax=Goodea atripinnis TaxID=208336 RepID=A0ABV0NVW4_9TELE
MYTHPQTQARSLSAHILMETSGWGTKHIIIFITRLPQLRRQLQQTQCAGSPSARRPGDEPQLSRHPLICSDFYPPPGFVCASLCGNVCINLDAPTCLWL